MSRLDYVTISIVVICLIALGFLVYKTIGLMTTDPAKKKQQTEQAANTDTEDPNTYEDTDSLLTEDLDDDEVSGVLDDPDDDTSEDELPEDAADLETENTPDPIDDTSTDDAVEENQDEAEPSRPASYSSGDYLVLAGSFRQMANAENQVKKLKSNGFENAQVTKFNKSTYAVALVDRFPNRSDAEALVDQLQRRGFEARVQKQKQ